MFSLNLSCKKLKYILCGLSPHVPEPGFIGTTAPSIGRQRLADGAARSRFGGAWV